jgi:hypothetical protein
MKKLIAFLLLFSAVAIVGIQACNKDRDESNQPNQPPVAFAGNDTTLLSTTCEPKVVLRLDGNKSYDPENNNSLSYRWKQLSGPAQAFNGVDTTRSVAYAYNLVSGEYKFELEITDVNGLSSKDSIIVNINNTSDFEDLDLDVTGVFEFHNNVQDFYYNDLFSDAVSVYGEVSFSNENFAYYFNGYSDSAVVNTQFSNMFSLYSTAGSMTRYINGICSVDFETLYLNGGGAFDGTIEVNSGSAFVDCESMMPDLPRIQISGNLNAASKTITMKIKGKFFL